MNGVHDLGGMDGFGPVKPEPDDYKSPFGEPWEGRVLAITRALGASGAWNIDVGRYGIERMPADQYLSVTYYEKWHARNEKLCVELGYVTADELAAGKAAGTTKSMPREALRPNNAEKTTVRSTYTRPEQAPARFAIGDRVRAKNIHPRSHTRLPRFVRGHVGTVERIQGCHVYPDSVVATGNEDPQWVYTVVFDGRDLWGEDGEPGLEVSVEAFEPYLTAAS